MGPIWLAVLLNSAPVSASSKVLWGGAVSTTVRAGTNGCITTPAACSWLHFYDAAVVSPWVALKPSDSVSVKAEIDLRFHGFGEAHGLEPSTDQMPWSLRFKDAWVAVRSDHTELKVGVQRIAWGVAQGISVVDTINPLNLEDPTRFDQRLSTMSGLFTAHTSRLAFTGVVIPYFVPAALPAIPVDLMSNADDLFDERFTGGKSFQIGELETRTDVPKNTIKNTAVAAQLRWTPPAGDFTLSWHSGRDSLPQVAGDMRLLGYQTSTDQIDVGVPLAYPRVHTYGFTARTSLPADLTFWSEVALSMHQRTVVRPLQTQLEALQTLGAIDQIPDPIPKTETQSGQPVLKWVAGMDRPFGPVRLMAQWLHGFFTERTDRDVKDYGLVGVRWNVSPIVRFDSTMASNFKGHLTDFSITYLHADTAEIGIGFTHIDGQTDSAFGGLKEASNIRTSLSMRF